VELAGAFIWGVIKTIGFAITLILQSPNQFLGYVLVLATRTKLSYSTSLARFALYISSV